MTTSACVYNTKYLLDLDSVIYTMMKRPSEVKKAFRRHNGQICLSTLTYMELVYGAERSANPEQNLRVIDGVAARWDMLSYDAGAATHTVQIRAELAAAGTPIGPYDQMIAGHTRLLVLLVITNKVSEFERIEGLRVDNWVTA